MKTRIHPLAMLLPAALLLTGCATSFVLDRASDQEVLHDRLEPVQRAYLTPDDRLVLCTSGTLGGDSGTARFTLDVPWQQYAPKMKDTPVRGKIAALPRTVFRAGWPGDKEVRIKKLQPIPISMVSYGVALGPEADAIRAMLQPLPETEHTLYNITGYGTQEFWTVVYVHNAEKAEIPRQVAFTIQPRVVNNTQWLLLLPAAVGTDAAIALGYAMAGGGGR